MAGRKALVIGIDRYDHLNNLTGCVNDAKNISKLLKNNEDTSPNFDVKLITSDATSLTKRILLNNHLKPFFTKGESDVAVLYFAGHGILGDGATFSEIASTDGDDPNWGIPYETIMKLANQAKKDNIIRSLVLIFDCCHSGAAGEMDSHGGEKGISKLIPGITVLTACDRNEQADEISGNGKFTSLLIEGLKGAGADVIGRITPPSLYALIDQTLGSHEQRPIYKANVQDFVELRRTNSKISLQFLRTLHEIFKSNTFIFPLDPSCEPKQDRGEFQKKFEHIEFDEEKHKIYRLLQKCCNEGLVTPHEQEHMWHAALHSSGCKLTPIGHHYRNLSKLGRF